MVGPIAGWLQIAVEGATRLLQHTATASTQSPSERSGEVRGEVNSWCDDALARHVSRSAMHRLKAGRRERESLPEVSSP